MAETVDLQKLQRDLAMVDLMNRKAAPDGFMELLVLRKLPIKLKMYEERGHALPHLHVDYSRNSHVASYALGTAERIEGNLPRIYDRMVSAWIVSHRDALLAIWAGLQNGSDIKEFVLALDGDDGENQ